MSDKLQFVVDFQVEPAGVLRQTEGYRTAHTP
jgi:hypothetical protein